MANPPCETEDGNPAIFMGTFLNNGQSVCLCENCLPQWAAAVVTEFTGVDVSPAFELAAQAQAEPAGTAEGAPTDEAPPEAPSDTDTPSGLSAGVAVESESLESIKARTATRVGKK